MQETVKELLEELFNLEARVQEIPGPYIEAEKAWDEINGDTLMGYKLSQEVPNVDEFLQLIEINKKILRLLDAQL